jgi:hypothetical protein
VLNQSGPKQPAQKRVLRVGLNMDKPRIVAVALVTQPELELLGPSFMRAYPVDETPCFAGLLLAIDEADRKLWRERDGAMEQ